MANITVTILLNSDIRYSPGRVVRHGDTVTFKLEGIPGEVDVSFDSASCLTAPGPYTLNGGSQLTSSSPQTVSSTAAPGEYPFTAYIPGAPRQGVGHEREVKKGSLDVTTDPPEDPKLGK